MLLALIAGLAHAGSGPWVPGTSIGNLYLGLDSEQFTRVASNDAGTLVPVDVGEGIGTVGLTSILSYGIGPRLELETRVPYRATHANREDQAICAALGTDACAPTRTIGVIEARMKGMILDELSGQPVSLAIGANVRFGGLTASTRNRITNAGEGTTDFGPRLALGRTGAIGSSYYALSLDASWMYRVPNTKSFPRLEGDRVVPGSEFYGELETLVSPGGGSVTLGPFAGGVYRPSGYDFGEIIVDDPDRLAALRILNIAAGAKLLLRDRRDHVFIVSVSRTIAAWNNPSDRLTVSVGVSLNDVFRIFDRTDR